MTRLRPRGPLLYLFTGDSMIGARPAAASSTEYGAGGGSPIV